jgi:cadmium resistance protein CadD (predicted permease)
VESARSSGGSDSELIDVRMIDVLSEILFAAVAFTSTNLDDLFLLSSLFVDIEFNTRSIIIGQFVGMSFLALVSVLAALFASIIPDDWFALLGLVPLYLGLNRFWKLWKARHASRFAQNGGFVGPEHFNWTKSRREVWTVIILTVANGGDNLSVYIPLFSVRLAALPLYLAVFTFMTGLWCVLAYYLTNHPLLRERLKKYGRIVIPFVLVGIGLHVVRRARSLFETGPAESSQ